MSKYEIPIPQGALLRGGGLSKDLKTAFKIAAPTILTTLAGVGISAFKDDINSSLGRYDIMANDFEDIPVHGYRLPTQNLQDELMQADSRDSFLDMWGPNRIDSSFL